MSEKAWKTYEEVAQYLLNEFAEHFKLDRVEEKQKIIGLRSGRKIEIDAKGVRNGAAGFVVVECKKWNKPVEPAVLEALAYRITDAGADGGIIVSPFDPQAGAKKIADHEKIITVRLNADATTNRYILRFLNQLMVGISDQVNLHEQIGCVIERRSANGIECKEQKVL